ncbi:LPXTG cell wall anchor domain-containing protein [Kitasatospora sp. NPDC001159]
MHARLRRGLPTLAVLGLTAGVPLLAAPAAHAGTDCGRGPVQYSIDGGTHWTADATMPAESGTVEVRLAGEPTTGCEYHVSLGSYATQGATWAASGHQTFLGWATTTLTRDHYRSTLDITAHLPQCYGELALYAVGEKYDGSDSDHPLPHYPDEPFSGLVIASWNGGTACTPKPTGSPTTTTPTPTPTSATAAPPPPVVPIPVPTGATTPTATISPAPVPSPTPSHSPQAPVAPAPTLAATGADDGALTATAVGAAALLAAGAAAVYVGRRRAARR